MPPERHTQHQQQSARVSEHHHAEDIAAPRRQAPAKIARAPGPGRRQAQSRRMWNKLHVQLQMLHALPRFTCS